MKMKKTEAIRWEKLEGEGTLPSMKHFSLAQSQYQDFHVCTLLKAIFKFIIIYSIDQYPSSSHYTRNWDKLVVDIKEEEKSEKLEGDAALNQLFQQIYGDGSDEVKRAMNKSFVSDQHLLITAFIFSNASGWR